MTLAESALLAGTVQSSEALNPYPQPRGARVRRNTVLDTMLTNFPELRADIEKAQAEPLEGVLRSPALRCGPYPAGDDGFFCDYALQFLAENGLRNTVLVEPHDPHDAFGPVGSTTGYQRGDAIPGQPERRGDR